jgi:hypothetical protein
LSKMAGILREYDIGSYTPDDEIMEHVLDLVDDARVAWPTDVFAEAMLREGNSKVWRYIFDQEGPARGIPHHNADLMYLFDWKPSSIGLGSLLDHGLVPVEGDGHAFWEGPFDVDEEAEEREKPIVSHNPPSLGSMSFEAALEAAAAAASAAKIDPNVLASSIVSSSVSSSSLSSMSSVSSGDTTMRSVADADWLMTTVDRFAYLRVRDTMQEKWLAFAYGEEPWTAWSGRHGTSHSHSQSNHPPDPRTTMSSVTPSAFANGVTSDPQFKPEKVFIFGPEGETGERGTAIFDGRRRRLVWREVLEPLGWTLVQKLGVELSRGPACDRAR